MTLRQQIEERAQRRAERAKEVFLAARELQTEGRISVDQYLQVVNAADAGYPYMAQEELERMLANTISAIGSGPEEDAWEPHILGGVS